MTIRKYGGRYWALYDLLWTDLASSTLLER
jgi:hypothetical protein